MIRWMDVDYKPSILMLVQRLSHASVIIVITNSIYASCHSFRDISHNDIRIILIFIKHNQLLMNSCAAMISTRPRDVCVHYGK
jgi:hypothetical protein